MATTPPARYRAERLFYEIEAGKQRWSVPQLERVVAGDRLVEFSGFYG